MPELVLCAAIYYPDGITYEHQPRNIEKGFVVAGRRHHNCLMTVSILSDDKALLKTTGPVQGFLTTEDRFIDRFEACKIAVANGQVKEGATVSGRLYSEDLY